MYPFILSSYPSPPFSIGMAVNRMKVACIMVKASRKVALTKTSLLTFGDRSRTLTKFRRTTFSPFSSSDFSPLFSGGRLSGSIRIANMNEIAESNPAVKHGRK